MIRRPIATAFATAALLLGAVAPAHAENLMAGSWRIVKAEPAPWADDKDDRADRQDVPLYVGKKVVFTEQRIDGPNLLGCEHPNYRMVDFDPPGLFQGTLQEFEERGGEKAETVATGIGFSTRPIKTLVTDCMHSIDYHMSDANHAAFMLNNVIYWLTRDGM